MKISIIFAALFLTLPRLLLADLEEGAYLDPPYKITPPLVDDHLPTFSSNLYNPVFGAIAKSDTLKVISYQSEVKTQGSRGTCSIFSATALLEAMLIRNRNFDFSVDLSEEWLEYVIMAKSNGEGSNSRSNFNAFRKYGTVYESDDPYKGVTWETADFGEAKAICGSFTGKRLKSCLFGHRDPDLLTARDSVLQDSASDLFDLDFLNIRNLAADFRDKNIKFEHRSFEIHRTSQIKDLLTRGYPLVMEISFYYGAWNHRFATELGMRRNMRNWKHGLVDYPESGSVDAKRSKEKPAGHSVVIVGFDDSIKVKIKKKMLDGTEKEFTYNGVYYFKNSWGTNGFGRVFNFERQNFPGYGAIVQNYAHEFGAFYQLPISN